MMGMMRFALNDAVCCRDVVLRRLSLYGVSLYTAFLFIRRFSLYGVSLYTASLFIRRLSLYGVSLYTASLLPAIGIAPLFLWKESLRRASERSGIFFNPNRSSEFLFSKSKKIKWTV